MIPLPWLLVGVGMLLAISNAISFIKGGEIARQAMLAAAAETSDRAVRRFNSLRIEDLEAARRAAAREGRARLVAAENRHQFELEAARGTVLQAPSKPGEPPAAAGPVQLSDAAVGLFNTAIDAYNAAAEPARGSRDAVPPDAPPRFIDPGRRGGPAHTAGQPLRLSLDLRANAPGGRGVAAKAD